MDKTISILGTEYKIIIQSQDENEKLKECLGLCEHYSKKIVLSDMKEEEKDVMCVENLEALKKKFYAMKLYMRFLVSPDCAQIATMQKTRSL